jgi:LysM repeat protein
MKIILSKSIVRIGGVALSVFLALSMMAAAFPQTALAAGTTTVPCATTHKIISTDTKSSIADTYKLKWWQIAQANNIAPNAKLDFGSTLCIPTKAWVASVTTGSMTATAVGKKLSVTMSDFRSRDIWNVRVKDASNKTAGYTNVGRIAVPQIGSVTGIYSLPQAFLQTPTLKVCVTSQASVVICQVIKHKM